VSGKPTDLSGALLLPSSVPREIKGVTFRRHPLLGTQIAYIKIYCANCGRFSGEIPEATKDFAFWLCDPCAEKWSPIAGTYLVPDEVWFERNKQEMIAREGRELTGPEIVERMRDPNHYLNKLVKDRPVRT
jgi:hypothetical protein